MNIWIFNHYAITPDMAGGTRHYDFSKELVKRGHKITIFASSFHYSRHKELKLNKNEKYKTENINGINFVWIKTFSHQKNDWRRVLNMISYMWRACWIGRRITKVNQNIDKPDIIMGSSVHLLAVLSAYCLSKYYKAKFIMEVRDLWPQTLIDIGRFKKNNPIIMILRLLEKFLYKKAEKIIVLMPLAGNYISALGINNKKIIWISNGVDLSKFSETEKDRKNSKYFKIMYLGAHGKANALDIILEAAKKIQEERCSEIKFLFIGDGPEKQNLIKYSRNSNLKNVEFRDSVSKKEVSATLAEADILIISHSGASLYKYGISPNKLFDYMATRKPIILAGRPINDVVTDAECGISVSPDNPKVLAEAIIKLYQMSSDERRMMGQKGREYVEKYHSIPVLVDKLEKVINEE